MSGVLTAGQVAQYHQRRPGITEDLLTRVRDAGGASPYDWLSAAVAGRAPVLDVGCGSAPLADLVRCYVGVDRSSAELRRAVRSRPGVTVVRADATRLPVRGPFAAVTASMSLMLAAPLEAVLAEIAGVLEPAGLLVATVPALVGGSGADGALHAAVLARLRPAGVTYPEALSPGDLATRFAACGLRLTADDERRFTLPLRDDADVRLLVESYYSPEAADADLAAAAALVRSEVGACGHIGYRLRRLIAVRA